MKKLLTLLGLSLAAGALVLAGVSKHHAEEAKATEYKTYIPMEAASFTNWTDDAGEFADRNATFWGDKLSFYALDTFYRGETKGDWQGTLNTITWKQHTQYIYFQFGGAKNYDVTGDAVHLNIHYGNHSYSMYNDTFVGNPMLLRYFKVPDAIYAELMDGYDDFDMYIEIVDYQPGAGYGLANFGYLHVNQTAEQVSDAMRYYLNNLARSGEFDEISTPSLILDNYYQNAGLREMFLLAAENANEDFENNETFLNHWYFDWHYFNNERWDLHFDRAIGTDSFRPDNNETNMPFNKTGNGYFRGWFENDELGGFVNGDQSKYRFLTRPFVLSGTGLVSIKMAGTASLHVVDAESRQELVWADSLTFCMDGNQTNLANSTFNTVTMIRHVINLEAYVGRKIQLAIADVDIGSWSGMYADELVTNYATYPGFKVDTFGQTNVHDTYYMYRPDRYINSTLFNEETNPTGLRMVLESAINNEGENRIVDHVDHSAAKEAFDFLQTYYGALRTPETFWDLEFASEDAKKSIVKAYIELCSAAKSIVNISDDIVYDHEDHLADWFRQDFDTSNAIPTVMDDLLDEYAKYTISFDGNGADGSKEPVENFYGPYTLPNGNDFVTPAGKQFAGWKVNGEGETLHQGDEIIVSEDVTLVAQWVNVYTVAFAPNGGDGIMASQEVAEGNEYTLPLNGFVEPEGYVFSGWKVGDEEELKQPGDKITVTGDVTITAQWELAPVTKYTVTFDANGGGGSMAPAEVESGEEYTLPDCSFKAEQGYKFDCWLVGDTQYQPGEKITVTEDVTVKAKWVAIVYFTVTFDAGEGSGSIASEQVEEGLQFPLPECGFTAPEGQQFSGWKVGNDEALKQPHEEITVTADVTVTAQYETIPVMMHTVSFEANGGKGSMASQSVEHGTKIVLPECGFTAPEGQRFIGWKVSGDTALKQPKEEIVVNSDLTITAQWEVIPVERYIVTFNANGGTGKMNAVQVTAGEQLTLPENGFTAPKGAEFDDWLIEGTKYQPGDKVTITKDTEVKANWKFNEEEQPKDQGEEQGQQGEQQEEKTMVQQVWETVRDFFARIYEVVKDFFLNLMK